MTGFGLHVPTKNGSKITGFFLEFWTICTLDHLQMCFQPVLRPMRAVFDTLYVPKPQKPFWDAKSCTVGEAYVFPIVHWDQLEC